MSNNSIYDQCSGDDEEIPGITNDIISSSIEYPKSKISDKGNQTVDCNTKQSNIAEVNHNNETSSINPEASSITNRIMHSVNTLLSSLQGQKMQSDKKDWFSVVNELYSKGSFTKEDYQKGISNASSSSNYLRTIYGPEVKRPKYIPFNKDSDG